MSAAPVEGGRLRTLAMTAIAAGLACGAVIYARQLVAMIAPEPLRGFILELRFVLGGLAAILVLSLAEGAGPALAGLVDRVRRARRARPIG